MKKLLYLSALVLFFPLFFSSCSVLEGRPEDANTEQAQGTSTWWEDRQNAELNAQQMNDQFGDASGDANNSYLDQDAVYTNRQDFDYLKKENQN